MFQLLYLPLGSICHKAVLVALGSFLQPLVGRLIDLIGTPKTVAISHTLVA